MYFLSNILFTESKVKMRLLYVSSETRNEAVTAQGNLQTDNMY